MPTYNEHVSFVSAKPYSKWYVIWYRVNKVGSIYLTAQNEVGIFIKKSFQNKNGKDWRKIWGAYNGGNTPNLMYAKDIAKRIQIIKQFIKGE